MNTLAYFKEQFDQLLLADKNSGLDTLRQDGLMHSANSVFRMLSMKNGNTQELVVCLTGNTSFLLRRYQLR